MKNLLENLETSDHNPLLKPTLKEGDLLTIIRMVQRTANPIEEIRPAQKQMIETLDLGKQIETPKKIMVQQTRPIQQTEHLEDNPLTINTETDPLKLPDGIDLQVEIR